jgi:hypothetical protein
MAFDNSGLDPRRKFEVYTQESQTAVSCHRRNRVQHPVIVDSVQAATLEDDNPSGMNARHNRRGGYKSPRIQSSQSIPRLSHPHGQLDCLLRRPWTYKASLSAVCHNNNDPQC